MHTINLIFTFHSEAGRYNAFSLYQAIQSINPDVIFEELPPHLYTMAYKRRESIAVEIDTIKMYLKEKVIDHIPVDTYKLSDDYYRKENERCQALSDARNTKEGAKLKVLTKRHLDLISQCGLSFLNSDENELLFNQEKQLEHHIIKQTNDDNLLQFELYRNEVINKREYEIVNTVYRYSEKNSYRQAIMFIGAGHQSTLLKVIEQFKTREKLELHWSLYLGVCFGEHGSET